MSIYIHNVRQPLTTDAQLLKLHPLEVLSDRELQEVLESNKAERDDLSEQWIRLCRQEQNARHHAQRNIEWWFAGPPVTP